MLFMNFVDLGDWEVNVGRRAIYFVKADYGLVTLFGFSYFSSYTFYYCFSLSIFTLFPGLSPKSNYPSKTYAD
jgi:hypothetical protein